MRESPNKSIRHRRLCGFRGSEVYKTTVKRLLMLFLLSSSDWYIYFINTVFIQSTTRSHNKKGPWYTTCQRCCTGRRRIWVDAGKQWPASPFPKVLQLRHHCMTFTHVNCMFVFHVFTQLFRLPTFIRKRSRGYLFKPLTLSQRRASATNDPAENESDPAENERIDKALGNSRKHRGRKKPGKQRRQVEAIPEHETADPHDRGDDEGISSTDGKEVNEAFSPEITSQRRGWVKIHAMTVFSFSMLCLNIVAFSYIT